MKTGSKIKLFVDAHSFDKEFQGTRTFIAGLYTALLSKYSDLDIYFGVSHPEHLLNSIPSINKDRILLYRNSGTILRFSSDIPKLIKTHQIDFAHFQYLSPLRKHCKYIVTTHDILFNDFPQEFSYRYRLSRNLLFKRAIKMADIKTTVSEYSKQRISFHYGIPDQNINVIPNGVSTSFATKFTVEEAQALIRSKYKIENSILYISRVEPRKNQKRLLKMFLKEQLRQEGFHLVFIGKDSLKDKEFDEMMMHLNEEEKKYIHWLQQVDDNDLYAFYKGCRLFVYPSKAEGFGIPPLEAAVSGVPVLCSNRTAMSDYNFFEPGFGDPDNEEEWTEKMLQLLKEDPDKKRLIAISQQVSERYNWENAANKFYQLISEHR